MIGFEREGGRGNGSFPVAEALKPLGFKERSDVQLRPLAQMFSKKNIKDIPIEETPHSSGSRRVLASKEDVPSKYFEACTYGYLPIGTKWAIHKHDNVVEICLVVKGKGIIRDSKGDEEFFEAGDRFIFPSSVEHEIENNSAEGAEFYFLRIKDK